MSDILGKLSKFICSYGCLIGLLHEYILIANMYHALSEVIFPKVTFIWDVLIDLYYIVFEYSKYIYKFKLLPDPSL